MDEKKQSQFSLTFLCSLAAAVVIGSEMMGLSMLQGGRKINGNFRYLNWRYLP